MTQDHLRPIIAFVWSPREITSSVVETARSTKTQAIFDLTATQPESAGTALLQADASGDAVDLRISPISLMDPELGEFLNEVGIRRLWVELHPALLADDLDSVLDRINSLAADFDVFPVMGSTDLISRVLDRYPAIRNIALKGNEAAGFVSSETTLTLYGSVRSMIRDRNEQPDLFIWGGIATPEAAAAFLSAGSQGVVFESIHWLTDLAQTNDNMRRRISNLRPDHTDLTGLNLEVPCRLFNKGNSQAVRKLKDFAGSLCGSEIHDEQRRFFAREIMDKAIQPLDSEFGREELIPLGVEAAFAASFVRRFGTDTAEAIGRFVRAIDSSLATSVDKAKAFAKSPVAREMGTLYPFIQGAMSWITDVPEFALKVSEAGGLPTIALGLMDGKTLDEKFGHVSEIMGNRPYAVNVITLSENPYRDLQLAWIRDKKPRFAVIAAGEPSHAVGLMEEGIEAIYIAPSEKLLQLAFDAGIRYVICEGHEAGGHVGQHSTLTLAQTIIDLKDRNPSLFEGRRIILAGGICNRETAFIAAMLGADAVQMGTSYLATKEIVETGALTKLYQRMILDSAPGATVVTGEGTGLRVRSLKTTKIEAICSLEREFAAGSEDESSFRNKIEALSAGSLFIAARGLDTPGGKVLDELSCRDQGQFMSGACAGTLKQPRSIEELHHELAEAPLALGLPVTGPIRETSASRPPREEVRGGEAPAWKSPVPRPAYRQADVERIAVTGMSQVNSLGNSPEEVWAACVAMKSGIIPVPKSKWDHTIFFNPRPRVSEKTYCKVGAFQNIEVSRKEIGIPPQDFRTMTDATKITMWLAGRAIEESRLLESDIPRERIAVLISQNSGEAAATLQDVIIRGSLSKIVSAVKKVLHLTPDTEKAIEEEVKAGRIAIDDTTLLGRLNCSAGGFICNKYGFMGPSYSVSAACATALVALYSAVQMIRNGIIDAAVVGGAEEYLTPMHFLEFSALGALAGLSGVDRPASEASRPFDMDRDGMVLGEGGGMIVIERESVARKRGARAHGYITSMGASNNHLGMVESSRITQEIAIQSSFKDSSYGPDKVDLVECHATSTRQGDVEEVHALKAFFNSGRGTVLTSFKSQIGHTLGASGVNSLIRGIMAMKAGILPPTLNYKNPDPEMEIEGSGLMIHPEPADWKLRNGDPRRLQVNAFGFGGSNYVVQVEQAMEQQDRILVSPPEQKPQKMDSGEPSPEGVQFFRTVIGQKPYRLSTVAESEAEAVARIQGAESLVNGGPIPPKRLKALARQGIHLGEEDVAAPPLAFVFPGQGSHYAGMGHELYQTFPVIREWMDRAAEVAEFDLLPLLFLDREEDLQKTRWQQPALFTIEYAMVQYLVSLGIRPTALAGHSLGELTALCLAGVYSFEDGFRIVNMRAICMDKACGMHVDPGVMMAVDAPADVLEDLMSRREKVYMTNINSPHQLVVGGDTEAVKSLGEELKELGYRNTLLRVSMAFHSPIMECIHDELEDFIAGIEFHAPKIPVISNTTMREFPADSKEIRRIVMAHLESPVHWMQNVRTLWDEYGVRLFVEVGPRAILSNLIADTIEEADCVQTCLPSVEASVYRTAIAQLFATGNLPVRRPLRLVSFSKTHDEAKPAPLVPAATTPRAVLVQGESGSVERIVQREINSFIMESFGRFLRPSLLAAIRRDYDPKFSEQSLEGLLGQMFPGMGAHLVLPQSHAEPAAVSPPVMAKTSPTTKAPVSEPASEPEVFDTTETVIRIIMEATGYERDEVEPDMDLREDLSIRSSRLPVIMDAVESHFGIKIELEDFMDVRTIRDISDRIAGIVARSQPKQSTPKGRTPSPKSEIQPSSESSEEKQSIRRVVFREVALDAGPTQLVELSPLESVTIFSATSGTGLRKIAGDVFRRDYGVSIVPLTFIEQGMGAENEGFDLGTDEGALKAAERLGRTEALAGMVFIVDEAAPTEQLSMKDLSRLLKGFFCVLKAFLESPAKKFVLLLHKSGPNESAGRLLAEGLLGMFLSAAQEFGSVQFRTVRIYDDDELTDAIRGSLDRGQKVIETIYNKGDLVSPKGQCLPSVFDESEGLELGPEDVVVFSGGGYGITSFLARSLVPFGCKMIFLGRTVLDPEIDFRSLVSEQDSLEGKIGKLVSKRNPGLSDKRRELEISRVSKAVGIVRTVEELRSSGIDAAYFKCDVTDPQEVRAVAREIMEHYGKINGIVHGAGILRDNFVKQMTPEDFAAAVEVKFLGAWNLFSAAKKSDLKFFTCLSSAAAIQGNPGQANYAAGNRIMSALMAHLRHRNQSIRFKALMLPPIEGAGMAEDPEIRELMKRMKAEYIHADELAGLFCRELLVASAKDVWVLFMRSLPDLSTVLLETSDVKPSGDKTEAVAVAFKPEDLPMIEKISRVDLLQGDLQASRSFTLERDLWIKDHKPFKFLKHPLVSAIMAVETFMEAARVLYPHLEVREIRDAQFLDIIECPPGLTRSSEISCRRIQESAGQVICEVSLASREISPSGRAMQRMQANYKARVLLYGPGLFRVEDLPGFPVTLDELDSRAMDGAEVEQWYLDRTDLRGRYRVIEDLDGTADGAIRGRMIYRKSPDFADLRQTRYQYSPYLLEALMQVVNFYIVMRDPAQERSMIPYRIGEVTFSRKCIDGEELTLEARMRDQNEEGIRWNARAVDDQGNVVMQAKNLMMRWFSK